jgi:hypothetical protein
VLTAYYLYLEMLQDLFWQRFLDDEAVLRRGRISSSPKCEYRGLKELLPQQTSSSALAEGPRPPPMPANPEAYVGSVSSGESVDARSRFREEMRHVAEEHSQRLKTHPRVLRHAYANASAGEPGFRSMQGDPQEQEAVPGDITGLLIQPGLSTPAVAAASYSTTGV